MTRKSGAAWGVWLILPLLACSGQQVLGDVAGGASGTSNLGSGGRSSANNGGGSSDAAGGIDYCSAGRNGPGGTPSSAAGCGGTGAAQAPFNPQPGPSNACETDCIRDLFAVQIVMCKLCHSARPAPNGLQSSGLDLESYGFTARLKDVPAKHMDIALSMGVPNCPQGDKLIDTANPAQSWLLKKIDGQQGNCGTSMPSTGQLTFDQKACVHNYVACVVHDATPPR